MAGRHDRQLLALAALAGTAAHAGPALCRYSPAMGRALDVRDRTDNAARVALTFDDGPHPQGTPAILEVLREESVRATFFLVGEQVERHRAVAAQVAAAGHAIGVHGHRHRNLLRLTPTQIRADFERAEAALGGLSAAPLRHYRPPYGVLTTAALLHARRHRWTPLLWTRWGRDWRAGATATTIADDAARGLAGGEVILLHDADHYSAPGSWARTVAALPYIVERARAAGLTFAA